MIRKLLLIIVILCAASCSHKLKDFYCGCAFEYALSESGGRKAVVDISTCGFVSKTGEVPSIQWEHIVPVSYFGRGRPCWEYPLCRDGSGRAYRGRRCCLKIDGDFKRIYRDKNNLKPVIGELNRARRDYPFGSAPEGDSYGSCYIKIDKASKTVEASAKIRGEIGRIYDYMTETYGLRFESLP